MSNKIWFSWLLLLAIGIMGFGVFMALFNGTELFSLFNEGIDPAFWHGGLVPEAAREFQTWVYGTWGATIAGWGVFLVYVLIFSFRRREPWAWWCFIIGIVVWFVFDTAISLYHRVYFNAGFNTLIFLLALVPLIATRKDFAKK